LVAHGLGESLLVVLVGEVVGEGDLGGQSGLVVALGGGEFAFEAGLVAGLGGGQLGELACLEHERELCLLVAGAVCSVACGLGLRHHLAFFAVDGRDGDA
jgi:hypothetical protein